MVHVEESKLFGGIPESQLAGLRDAITMRRYSAEQVIFTEGDAGDGLYLITEGQVRISAWVSKDERRTLSELGPGDFFGEMAVVDSEPRSATATAHTEAELCFIPRDKMLAMLEGSPSLAVTLTREFSLRLREFNRHYIQQVLESERMGLVGRFAGSIVHDFKNPLNIIGIAADFAAMENATFEMRQTAKNRIRKQVDRLSTMISELLEFTRGSQRGGVLLAETQFSDFVRAVVGELRPESEDGQTLLEFETDPPPVTVLLDPKRFFHVFSNLVHNAFDAMPDGGRLRIGFKVGETDVTTEFHDSGPGIAPEIMERMFEAFATYGKSKGTGLGLSICKRIVEDHKGRIEARNHPDGGAAISFSLPIVRR
ncbi:MAG: cyclic nucleotide-binding domain-containing protein [Verrucomicrobia bacterium]|nr:cyclic nucleotide-binding domain-containing protein [Verrucomicrobiota bacterium]